MCDSTKAKDRSFIPLSWEHHYGLVVSRRVHLGIKKNIDAKRIIGYNLNAWDNHISSHFHTEETLLLPNMKADQSRTQEVMKKIEKDHEDIRTIVQSIRRKKADKEILREFATLLHDHIRFEERELFPLAEGIIDREKLKEIDRALYESFREIEDSWADKFWLS